MTRAASRTSPQRIGDARHEPSQPEVGGVRVHVRMPHLRQGVGFERKGQAVHLQPEAFGMCARETLGHGHDLLRAQNRLRRVPLRERQDRGALGQPPGQTAEPEPERPHDDRRPDRCGRPRPDRGEQGLGWRATTDAKVKHACPRITCDHRARRKRGRRGRHTGNGAFEAHAARSGSRDRGRNGRAAITFAQLERATTRSWWFADCFGSASCSQVPLFISRAPS